MGPLEASRSGKSGHGVDLVSTSAAPGGLAWPEWLGVTLGVRRAGQVDRGPKGVEFLDPRQHIA